MHGIARDLESIFKEKSMTKEECTTNIYMTREAGGATFLRF